MQLVKMLLSFSTSSMETRILNVDPSMLSFNGVLSKMFYTLYRDVLKSLGVNVRNETSDTVSIVVPFVTMVVYTQGGLSVILLPICTRPSLFLLSDQCSIKKVHCTSFHSRERANDCCEIVRM